MTKQMIFINTSVQLEKFVHLISTQQQTQQCGRARIDLQTHPAFLATAARFKLSLLLIFLRGIQKAQQLAHLSVTCCGCGNPWDSWHARSATSSIAHLWGLWRTTGFSQLNLLSQILWGDDGHKVPKNEEYRPVGHQRTYSVVLHEIFQLPGELVSALHMMSRKVQKISLFYREKKDINVQMSNNILHNAVN